VKKDLSDDLVDAREPRLEVHGYEAYEGGDYTDEASDKVAMEENEEKEDEELGFFKRIEKSIASFFLDNPLARAGDEGGVLSPLTNFWTDNFSWDYGRSHL